MSFTDDELRAAVESLSDPEAFAEAEAIVSRAAPELQGVLVQALQGGGWFEESHTGEIRKAAVLADETERLAALRTILAEETRIGMMVGVAVGWALAHRLGEANAAED